MAEGGHLGNWTLTFVPTRHAKALQDSLLLISNRIEAIKKGNERLDSNNEFLHKSIKDLTGMRWTMT